MKSVSYSKKKGGQKRRVLSVCARVRVFLVKNRPLVTIPSATGEKVNPQ